MKAWCLFEQSGTFKNEFIKLGINAVDIDIRDDFAQIDYKIDLFAEINKSCENKISIFDKINNKDIALAFFHVPVSTQKYRFFHAEKRHNRKIGTMKKKSNIQ